MYFKILFICSSDTILSSLWNVLTGFGISISENYKSPGLASFASLIKSYIFVSLNTLRKY